MKYQKQLFFIGIFLFCIAMGLTNNNPDNDLWARLIVGNHTLSTFTVFKNDFLSYTPTHFWYDHEWGASLVFYTVFKFFGGMGLTVLKGLMSFSIVFFIFKIIELRTEKQNTPYNILYYLAAFLGMFQALSSTVRCHLFTFLFFAIWIFVLEKYRKGEKKWIFYLPFSMIFWGNIHGGCVSGLGLLLIYALGEFLNKKPYKEYLKVFIFSFLALFINSYGPEYVKFLLMATTMKRPIIGEWQSTLAPYFMFKYIKFKVYAFFMLIIPFIKVKKYGFSYEKADKTKFLLLLTTAILAIMHIKHQPFFVITFAAFLYDDFYNLYNERFKNNLPESYKNQRIIFFSFLTILFAVLAFAKAEKNMVISNKIYPVYTIEFIKENKIPGNLFTDFNYGSYASYKLYPQNKIAIDGRYEEVYNPKLLDEVRNFQLLKDSPWNKFLLNYPTDIIIIEKKYPLFKKLSQEKEYKMVFDDKAFAVFLLREKVQENYIYPTTDVKYYDKTMFDTSIKFKKD